MVELYLSRKKYTDKQVIGTMDVYLDNVFVCSLSTLEQEDNNNEIGNSCIPKGTYPVEHYSSEKYPKAFIVKETEPRTYILIHALNYSTQTEGCIGVGYSHADINHDGYSDVIHSKTAMKRLYGICKGQQITLKIE